MVSNIINLNVKSQKYKIMVLKKCYEDRCCGCICHTFTDIDIHNYSLHTQHKLGASSDLELKKQLSEYKSGMQAQLCDVGSGNIHYQNNDNITSKMFS